MGGGHTYLGHGGQRAGKLVLAATTLAMAFTSGCAHKAPLETCPRLAQADGRVAVRDKRYGVRVVSLRVKPLTPPNELAPGANVFVLWARDAEGVTNLGPLQLRDDVGAIEAVAPRRAYRVFVTAERSPDAPTPSTDELLFADVATD